MEPTCCFDLRGRARVILRRVDEGQAGCPVKENKGIHDASAKKTRMAACAADSVLAKAQSWKLQNRIDCNRSKLQPRRARTVGNAQCGGLHSSSRISRYDTVYRCGGRTAPIY